MGLQFEKLPQHVQDRIRRDNPDAFRPVETKVAKPASSKALVGGSPQQAKGAGGVAIIVGLIVLSRRAMDSDNLVGSCKPLRDSIAESLGLDDGDSRITWEYGWQKTSGPEGVAVCVSAQTEP